MSEGQIHLDSPIACRQELERVANGIASLTVDHTRAMEDLDELERTWDLVEAGIYNALNLRSGATAAEVRSAALEAMSKEEKIIDLRNAVKAKQTDIKTLERRLKSLEKRMGAAQSALRDHDSEARSAGYSYGGSE